MEHGARAPSWSDGTILRARLVGYFAHEIDPGVFARFNTSLDAQAQVQILRTCRRARIAANDACGTARLHHQQNARRRSIQSMRQANIDFAGFARDNCRCDSREQILHTTFQRINAARRLRGKPGRLQYSQANRVFVKNFQSGSHRDSNILRRGDDKRCAIWRQQCVCLRIIDKRFANGIESQLRPEVEFSFSFQWIPSLARCETTRSSVSFECSLVLNFLSFSSVSPTVRSEPSR